MTQNSASAQERASTGNPASRAPDKPSRPVRVVLSIAGSDSSGGAGIQADIKTGGAFGVFVATAITALTAQNSERVAAIYPVAPEQVVAQIEAVAEAMPLHAIKIGMLGNLEILNAVADCLMRFRVPLVVDPVLGATSGSSLVRGDDIVPAYISRLLPLATVVTPNLEEAARMLGGSVATSYEEMEQQAMALLDLGANAVLLKGGHGLLSKAVDYLATEEGLQPFGAPRLQTNNTHGTGCTLSTAIAAGLAQGLGLPQSIAAAKTYIQGAIGESDRLQLVTDNGPVHHFYQYW